MNKLIYKTILKNSVNQSFFNENYNVSSEIKDWLVLSKIKSYKNYKLNWILI